MPIDPDIKEVLEQISPLIPKSFEGIDPVQFRTLSDSYALASMKKIEIEKVEDIEIPVSGARIKGRLYSDDENSESLIVFFHGGGFVIGSIETHDSVCRVMAKYSKSKVISVDYRLAPEHKFPVAVDDAYDSFKWIRENHEKYGIRKDKIAVSGDSSGANLCVALSLKLRDHKEELPKLVVLFYPFVAPDNTSRSYSEFSEGLSLTSSMMEWFGQQYIKSTEDLTSPYFSPLLSNGLCNMPETIIVTAEFDPLRDQGETFIGALRKRGVRATGMRGVGMIHGFLTFHERSPGAHNILTMTSRLIGDRLEE